MISGSLRFLDTEGDVLAFVREAEGDRLICVFNFADEPASWALSDLGAVEAIDLGLDNTGGLDDGNVVLPGLGCFLGRLA